MEQSLTPGQEAEDMGEFLIENRDLHEEVLVETIDSAENGQIKESGRTVCGPETTLPPQVRFPRSVRLQRCPVANGAGIIHSHVSHDELMSPQHSIPDVANVILVDNIVASMVVGLDQSELLLAPADRDAGHAAFETAIGVPVDTPADVQEAVERGQIESFHAVRRRLKRELSPLFQKCDTAFPELKQRVENLALPQHAPVAAHAPVDARGEPIAACETARRLSGHTTPKASTAAGRLRQKQSECGDRLKDSANDLGLGERIVDSAIGSIIGRGVEAVLFP